VRKNLLQKFKLLLILIIEISLGYWAIAMNKITGFWFMRKWKMGHSPTFFLEKGIIDPVGRVE